MAKPREYSKRMRVKLRSQATAKAQKKTHLSASSPGSSWEGTPSMALKIDAHARVSAQPRRK
jgi:hypothetical protein